MSLQEFKFPEQGIIARIRAFLASKWPNYFPLLGQKTYSTPSGLKASFQGFTYDKVGDPGHTTTWQRTGQTGTDFRFYPMIRLTPDVNGDYQLEWNYNNHGDGEQWGFSEPTIINVFPGLISGQATDLKLIDNRDPSTGRDPAKNGSISVGDDAFAYRGKQDGQWHNFRSDVTVRIRSPSGAVLDISGALDENFKSVGSLSGSLIPFSVDIV